MSWSFVRTEPGDDPIIVEGFFTAPPARVFRAWTDPRVVEQWFGPAPNTLHSAAIDLRPGGSWVFLESSDASGSVGFEGEYLVVEPDRRLVFTWSRVVAPASGEREATRDQGRDKFRGHGCRHHSAGGLFIHPGRADPAWFWWRLGAWAQHAERANRRGLG